MTDAPLPPKQAEVMSEALHTYFPLGDDNVDDNPYWVPVAERVDDDSLDPNSVADPNGADLSGVNPDEGELVYLEGLL